MFGLPKERAERITQRRTIEHCVICFDCLSVHLLFALYFPFSQSSFILMVLSIYVSKRAIIAKGRTENNHTKSIKVIFFCHLY